MAAIAFDSYGYKARMRPVFIAAYPPILAALAWSEPALSLWSWIGSLTLTVGLPYALGERAADAGRKRQPALWALWGGSPTIRLLRHRTSSLSPISLKHAHAALTQLAGEQLPGREQEAADEVGAERVYERCEERMRVIAREHQQEYSSVLRANTEYGYRRNLWAIRGWAWAGAGVAVIAAVIHIYLSGLSVLASVAMTGALVNAIYLHGATENWVREAADLYALRLVENCERMARDHAAPVN